MSVTSAELFGYGDKIKATAHQIFASGTWNDPELESTDPKIIAIFLLVRTLSNFEGLIELIRSPRIVEARILARRCFENLFAVAALRDRGSSFVKDMIEDHKADRKARGEFLLEQTAGHANRGWEHKLRSFLKKIAQKDARTTSLSPKRVAKMGPLLKGYVFYAELSADAAHPTLDALQRYFVRAREGGEVVRGIDINPPPKPREAVGTLLYACEALLGVCVGCNEMLGGTAAGAELAELVNEYQLLADRF